MQELDKSGLAGAGVSDEADASSGSDAERKVAEKWRTVSAVAECHAVKEYLTARNPDWIGPGVVRNTKRLLMEVDHLFHFVHRPLQVGDMLPDVAQVAMHDEVAGEHKGYVAGGGAAMPPEPCSIAHDEGTQGEQNDELQ